MLLHFYAAEPDGRYRLVREEQVQRAWTQEELEEALLRNGFGRIRFYGEKGLLAPHPKDERLHVLAQLPAQPE